MALVLELLDVLDLLGYPAAFVLRGGQGGGREEEDEGEGLHLGLGDDVCLQERCQLASDADGVDMGLFYRATFCTAHVELAEK